MSTNQEGKHPPEQKILIPEQKRKEWREAITMIFAGVGHPDSIHFYTMGRSDEFASQSSELSKLREELKTTAEKFHLSDEQLKKLNGVLVSPQMRIATTESPVECDEPCYVFDGSIKVFKCATSCAGLKNCEVEIHKKQSLDEIQTNKIAKLQHSLTERDAEIERLKQAFGIQEKIANDNVAAFVRVSKESDAKDKEIDQLRFSLQCAATDANDLRESNRELVEYLKYLRPFLKKAGRDTGGLDALVTKSKPTE